MLESGREGTASPCYPPVPGPWCALFSSHTGIVPHQRGPWVHSCGCPQPALIHTGCKQLPFDLGALTQQWPLGWRTIKEVCASHGVGTPGSPGRCSRTRRAAHRLQVGGMQGHRVSGQNSGTPPLTHLEQPCFNVFYILCHSCAPVSRFI